MQSKKSKIIAMVLTVFALAFYLAGTGFREQVYNYLFPPAPKTITYYCREGIVTAVYMDQKVRLALPDGRKFELPQVVAASGIRFSDGKREFWSKGANAFVTENNKLIFSDGVAGTVDHPNRNMAVFTDSSRTFSFSYPRRFILSGKGIGLTPFWRVGAMDSGAVLALVTISKSYAPKTNFSGVEFIIGQSSDPKAVKHCFEKPQEYEGKEEQVKLHGIPFTQYTFSDAGAGNLYETTSYRTKRGEACYVVEYTIHSTNIGMYSPDQGIKEFDKGRMAKMLEKMVRSFKLL